MSNLVLYAVLAAMGAAALVLALYVWLNRRRIAADRALRERLGDLASSSVLPADSVSILRGVVESESVLDRMLSGRSVAATIEEETRRSGLNWSVGQFASYVLLGLLLGLVAGLFTNRIVALIVGLAGTLTPFLIVSQRKAKRIRKIEEQLPDAVDMLVNALRAGYSLQAGMNFVGTELTEPVGTEFTRFYDEQRLGMDVRQALQNLTDRLGTLDARMFVLAIIIQRETGGNLSEILTNIATVIRERINFRMQLEVMTAEARLSAIFLSVLPLILFLLIRTVNPGYVSTLTTTESGQFMVSYGLVSLFVGFLILRKMAKIEV